MKKITVTFVLLSVFLSLFTVILVSVPALCHAESKVTLQWDPNIENDLKGYRVYYKSGATDAPGGAPYNGVNCQQGPSPITYELVDLDDPGLPTVPLVFPEGDFRVYFVVTAFDTEGLESTFSNEVSMTWPHDVEDGKPPLAPWNNFIKSLERILRITKIERYNYAGVNQ